MPSFFASLSEQWEVGDVIFLVSLAISVLTILYAISLVHRKIRLIEGEIQAMRKDQTVISEELELIASAKGGRRT
ncbi:MAG TPA: hypothetical protein VI895_01820 [Bdellovibrionota bacterium]|nr:hypothetical protein [Bdellovibrionota bacterium]